jgi:hypothetical protein
VWLVPPPDGRSPLHIEVKAGYSYGLALYRANTERSVHRSDYAYPEPTAAVLQSLVDSPVNA